MDAAANSLQHTSDVPDVIVVGGGLAGLAAATALAEDGARVTLLERRPELGGRAYSYEHASLGETLDSQHVLLGCCTNLEDMMRRAGADHNIRWYDELLFLEPNGGRSVMKPGALPAPAHQTMSFLRASMLSLEDKARIASGLCEFLRGYPADDHESFATWLDRTKQTARARLHFWEPVVLGALNDTFENTSTKYAGKVFHETFLRSPAGGRLGIPALPLTEFFQPAIDYAQRLGVQIHRKEGASALERLESGGWRVRCGDDSYEAPTVILALDRKGVQGLTSSLGDAPEGLLPAADASFVASPITTVHLWYDRDVTGVDHAVLLDTRIQWVFTKSRIRGWPTERGSYQELTISASRAELKKSREAILDEAVREFELFFPAARTAKLSKSNVLKEARATFSVVPGLDRFRPSQATNWPGLFLAGDWTQTEWPSTMEGAVRSGRLAAGAVRGELLRFLSPELAAEGWMRWLSQSHPPLARFLPTPAKKL